MRKIVFLFIAIVLFSLAACQKSDTQAEGEALRIVASFYPLEDFAKNITGNSSDVRSLTPTGVEPHEYEPSPRDIEKMYNSDIVLANGAGLEPWLPKIRSELESNGVIVIVMAEHVSVSKNDPHLWLDPISARKQAEIIRDALIQKDSPRKADYERNSTQYLKALENLDADYRDGLSQCAFREAIVAHDAFGYLGERYNITFTSIAGLSPEAEPTLRALTEVANYARSKNIRYIFFETLTSPRIADTIAQEVGAETLVLNPIEGLTKADIAAGKDYLSLMRDNLANLKIALGC